MSQNDAPVPHRSRTRERILDGAVDAIARHGLGELTLGDVSDCAGVSRATVYRYFGGAEDVLAAVARREGRRFQNEMERALREAPVGSERIHVALQHAALRARAHPILHRIAETDPAFLLGSLRREFPAIKKMFAGAFGPLLAETALARKGIATVDEVVDWLTRIMISAYLFPDPTPEKTADQLGAVYRLLTIKPQREALRSEARRSARGSSRRPRRGAAEG